MINILTVCGIATSLWGVSMLIFPPKYDNRIYGVRTPWTTKNQAAWTYGQKTFGCILIVLGLIFTLGSLTIIETKIEGFISILLLVGSWQLSKLVGHKIIEAKYPT